MQSVTICTAAVRFKSYYRTEKLADILKDLSSVQNHLSSAGIQTYNLCRARVFDRACLHICHTRDRGLDYSKKISNELVDEESSMHGAFESIEENVVTCKVICSFTRFLLFVVQMTCYFRPILVSRDYESSTEKKRSLFLRGFTCPDLGKAQS